MKNIKDYLHAIKEYYWEHAPYHKEFSFEPITKTALEKFEQKIGFTLHKELVDFLLHCNFQIIFDGNFIYEGPAQLMREWEHYAQMIEEGVFDDTVAFKMKHGFTNWEDKRIGLYYLSKMWIAIAIDGGGNALCIDHSPGIEGRLGQVINMEFQDGQGPFYVKTSLLDYLNFTYACLVDKKWRLEEYGNNGEGLISIDSWI